ncbi:MAG: tetratricopeptide repeat protein [Chthoniobacterales bacterium]
MKFRALLTSLLLVSQLAFAQDKQTSEQLYQEAYENFVKRDYTAASASLDKINPVDQKKADILNLRGAIYKRLGELDNAANAYSDALKINPKDWVPKYNLAEVNFLREQYKPARTFLEQALASMPEADRLQKQDLILYKVYLTYLLQGDDEKAKLLLDSFDINSPNPVYYFAQAAWSYKKKDLAKAKTWVNSTDGLYSQDLRNSYSQALVDVGWLEPSEGVAATSLTANPAPSVTPMEVAMTSPTPAAAVVPLATNNATPIAVVEPSATPQPSATSAATPVASIPEPAVASETKKSDSGFIAKIIAVLALLGVTSILLINLAKKSRIVPPPEDNIGYDAIAASGSPDATNAIAFSPEGTGVVIEQDENGGVPPAAIRVSPIHREYPEAAADAPTRKGRKTSTGKTSSGGKPSPKSVLNAETKEPVSLKKTPAKAAVKTTSAAAAPAARSTKAAKPEVKPAPAAKAPTKPAKATTKSTGGKRVRLVPVSTIDVPPPEVPPAKLMVSNIEVLRADPTKESAPAEAKPASKPASKTKAKPAKATAKVAAKPAPKAPAPRPASLITIPEFEDAGLEPAPTTVIRLVPESAPKEDDSKNV